MHEIKMDDRYITLPDLPDGYSITIKAPTGQDVTIEYPIKQRPVKLSYYPISE